MIEAQAPPIKSGQSLNATSQGSDLLRRILAYIVLTVLVVVLWEGSKAIFAIPDYKLPHLSQIARLPGVASSGRCCSLMRPTRCWRR
jgi:ABC-type nitrate/sulfonate/bicarbonate transport system permease component